MQKPSILSSREKYILLVYLLSLFLVVGIYLLLGVLRGGLPVLARSSGSVEVAVLVPLSGPQEALGKGVFEAVSRAVAAPPVAFPLGLQATVIAYDTGGTPDGAASAALRAAKNPNTAVIIGPLDARQVLAAVEVIQPYPVALITPASTVSALPVYNYPNFYRIPAPDALQGQVIVDFLTYKLQVRDVFVIAEPAAFVPEILDNFNNAAQVRLRVVGNLVLSDTGAIADIAGQIQSSQAQAVVFLGGATNCNMIVQSLNSAGLKLPLLGTDALNTTTMLPLPENSITVYYTSSILNLAGLPNEISLEAYRQALGDAADSPFSYESTQAAWLTLEALAVKTADQTPRQAVLELLSNASVGGLGGQGYSLVAGQRFPMAIYVYQIDPGATDWKSNPVVYYTWLH